MIIAFLLSLITTLLLIRYSYLHKHISADHDLDGVQKFHLYPVPRVGGIGLIIGLLGAFGVCYFQNQTVASFGLLLLVASAPAFMFGLIEDLTKRISVSVRLVATVAAAGFACYLFNGWLFSLEIWGVDSLMKSYPWFAIALTCFAVAGLTNAFNIIDGYNGLSGMVGVIILGGITYVAFQLNDLEIIIASLAMIGVILGFFVFNYPRGLIFLGDGGAYLIGFWVAELSVLLTVRHTEVSKWFPVLLCIYPIFETIFTVYRRVAIKRTRIGMPDAFHMHQLIYMRIVRWAIGTDDNLSKVQRNAITSIYLWVLTSFAVIPAILFWRYQYVLIFFIILFTITYVYIYRTIVRFKTPKWARIRQKIREL